MMAISYGLLAQGGNSEVYPTKEVSSKLVNRSVLGAVSMVVMFYNLSTLPLHVLNTILRSSAIFTFIISIGLGRERFSFRKLLCVLVCTAGASLVVNQSMGPIPTSDIQEKPITGFAVLMGFLNAIMRAVVPIMMENYGKINPLLNSLFVSISSAIVSIFLLTVMGNTVSFVLGTQLFLQLLCGVLEFATQTGRSLALRYETASAVIVIESLGLILSFIYQASATRQAPSLLAWLGGALVMVSMVCYTLLGSSKIHPPIPVSLPR